MKAGFMLRPAFGKPEAVPGKEGLLMQDTTELTGLRLSQRLEQLLTSGSYPMLCLWYGAGATVTAMAHIVGDSAPFGVAYVAAVPFRFTLPAALGMVLGYLLGSGPLGGFRYIAAGLLLTLLRWLLRPERWERWHSWAVPLSAGGAILAAGVLPFLYSDPLLYDIIMWGTQVVIAAAAASFTYRALTLLDSGAQGKAQDTALWVLFCIAVMGLCTAQAGGVSAGRIAAAAAVLFAARVGGVVAATMTGVIAGFATGFATGAFSLCVTMYSLGGLMAGVFGPFGRVGSAVAFTAAYGFAGMLAGGSGASFVEVAVAALLFLLVPQPWFKLFAASIYSGAGGGTVRTLVAERLGGATAALRDLSKTTADVASRLGRLYTGDISGIYDRAGERVCRRCPYNVSCWQESHGDTVDALAHGLRRLSKGEGLTGEDFPEAFSRCIHRDALAQVLTGEFGRYVHRDEEQRRTARVRRLLSDQIEGMAAALEDLSGQIDGIREGDGVLEAKAESVLQEFRLEPQRVACWRSKQGRLTLLAEIPPYKEPRSAPEQLCVALGEALETPLAFPTTSRSGKLCRLLFCERPRFAVEYGSCQLNCADNPVCGDSFRILGGDGTTASLLLSDGMGSGNGAAVDSAMTATLAARLLEAGLSYRAALKLINGALLVKSGEETLATLDAVQIDLYTGHVDLYKAGAAPTVVRKDGRGVEIDVPSLPAGILEGVEFTHRELTLEDGDLLVMLSDGAAPDGSTWIARAVESTEEQDLDRFCRKLATGARLRRTDGRDDDITVICCRLTLAKA